MPSCRRARPLAVAPRTRADRSASARATAPSPGRHPAARLLGAAIGLAATLLVASGTGAGGPSAAAASPTPTPTPGAERAATVLTKVRTLEHTLRGNFNGAGSQASFSSPAISDINGDGVAEIVTATVDGWVFAYNASGQRIWQRDVGRTSIQSSPAIAELTGDGKADVVVGTMDGRVLLLNGPTGAVVRTFSDGGLQGCRPQCFPRGFHSTPAIGDVNGDGILDIVASSYNHHLYAWSRGGTRLVFKDLYDTSWSSPVIADVDRNGSNEIIVASDVEATNPVLGGPAGGVVWVLRGNGSTYPGYPKRVGGQTLWSSPAVGDINGDGLLDVVIGSGAFFPDPAGRRVVAFTARSGANLAGWPVNVDGRVVGSPALGDVNGDGTLEVVFSSEGGWLYAYNRTGSRRWRSCNGALVTACGTGSGTHASPALADVDADGQVEVVSVLERNIRVFNASTGALEEDVSLGNSTNIVASGTPSIGEIAGRTVVLHQGHQHNGAGSGYAGAGDFHRVQWFTSGTGLCRAPWPTFKGNPRRSALAASTTAAWHPFACPAPFVDQQYRDFLGRDPDASGRAAWTARMHDGGRSGSWVINSFLRSQEFGGVVAPVVRAHLALTGSYPRTAAEVRADVARLRQGTSIATVTNDLIAGNAALASLDDTAFVETVFPRIFGRAPSTGERDAAVAALAGGTSRGAWVAFNAEGGTAKARLAASVDVTMVYLGMLDRAPDSAGWAYWVPETAAKGPDRLIRGFQVSREYAERVL